jgi:hypothetical protein
MTEFRSRTIIVQGIVLYAIASLMVLGLGELLVMYQKHLAKEHVREEIEFIASLKMKGIESWLNGQLTAAAILQGSQHINHEAQLVLGGGPSTLQARRDMLEVFSILGKNFDLKNAY